MNDELKRVQQDAKEKYKKQLKFLDNYSTDFSGKYNIAFSNEDFEISGTMKFDVVDVKPYYRLGEVTAYILVDVTFKNLKTDKIELITMLNEMIKNNKLPISSAVRMLPFIKEAPEEKFYNIRKYLSMDDVYLELNSFEIK